MRANAGVGIMLKSEVEDGGKGVGEVGIGDMRKMKDVWIIYVLDGG